MFDYHTYPVFVFEGQDARSIAETNDDFTKTMEVYDLRLPLEPQLAEHRAYHIGLDRDATMTHRNSRDLRPYLKHCRALYNRELQRGGRETFPTFEDVIDTDFQILYNQGQLLVDAEFDWREAAGTLPHGLSSSKRRTIRHDFLVTDVFDDGSKHLWHGYPDECFSFTSFVDSLVGLLVCGGWFIQQPITVARKAIVIDFVSEREVQAESSLAHGWNSTWEYPMGTDSTVHSRIEVNEQNAKIGRHLTVIGSAMTQDDFFRAVGEKLLDLHNCTDPSCTICTARSRRGLADVFQILASGTKQSEVHLFSRFQPSPALVELLRADGIALIAHDLSEIPEEDLEANRYYHLWDGTEDQGHKFRQVVWAPDWRINVTRTRTVACRFLVDTIIIPQGASHHAGTRDRLT